VTPEPVGIVSTRRLVGVATVVRAFSRPRRGKTILEPESGWVRANFDRFVAIRRFAALDGLRAVSVIGVVWHHTSGILRVLRVGGCKSCDAPAITIHQLMISR
jgi:hypothetical protein